MKINKKVMQMLNAHKNTAWAMAFFYECVQHRQFEEAMWCQFEYLLALDEQHEAMDALTNKDWDDKTDLLYVLRGYPVR